MKNFFKSKTAKLVAFGTAVMGSASAFAADHSAALQAATDEGSANYTLVITGVITLAAISFGVGMVVSWLRK
ncbi:MULTISPECIES: hypothetical protein [unclassified Pseudoalteromonas]|uniref:hypothetical protein n=1 Tax=unclassified Pseudoalteromonas TaxID=194690 RepID=UPI0025B5860C|nr:MULTISPECIES: hypothetical protein [unclassified Pseudoalteromonas]MDN3380978.1 hypothetical protein [Pseudoalteromonas sp. APC 3893]MDN3389401.1 hypothetical protein [Pseudoalteromonas sp. APC 4017]